MTKPLIARKTEQQIFDTAMHHLHQQNWQARDSDTGNCMYRESHGMSCGVGCLITDREYDEAWENNSVDDLIECAPKFPKALRPYSHLLRSIQNLHDSSFHQGFTKSFKEIARELAVGFRLDTSILDGLKAKRPHRSGLRYPSKQPI